MKAWKPAHNKPLVCVHWLDADASSPTEAFYEEEITDTTTPVETYGLLIKETANAVFLMTETYMDEGKRVFRGKTRIPRSLVKEIEVLRGPHKAKNKTDKPVSPELPAPDSS